MEAYFFIFLYILKYIFLHQNCLEYILYTSSPQLVLCFFVVVERGGGVTGNNTCAPGKR